MEEDRLHQIMDEDYKEDITSTKGLYHQEHSVEHIENFDENEFYKIGSNTQNLDPIPEAKISEIDDFLSEFKVIDGQKPKPDNDFVNLNEHGGNGGRPIFQENTNNLKPLKKKQKTKWKLWRKNKNSDQNPEIF